MGSDKVPTLLEEQLKTLAKKVRLDILKALYFSNHSLAFSDLKKEISQDHQSTNLSYHLKNLKETNLIHFNSQEEGYFISLLGRKIMKEILTIEGILSISNKKRFIRTSDYSTEPFNINKVKKYLMKEADLNAYLAEKISNIVKKRISRTDIKYWTTPLVREYVNGILLEEGLEEARHKLTRLGVPPYDTAKLFKNPNITPDYFIENLGEEVSKQFLLLNLLPKNLADLYLSRKIHLLHLEQWAIKPLAFFIDGNTLLKNINPPFQLHPNHKKKHINLTFLIKILNKLSSLFSDLFLTLDMKKLLKSLDFLENPSMELWEGICSQFSFLNTNINMNLNLNNKSFISQKLGSSREGFWKNIFPDLFKTLKNYRKHNFNFKFNPSLFFIDYTQFKEKADLKDFIDKFNREDISSLIFFKGQHNILSSQCIFWELNGKKILNKPFKVILDKIFINLYEIALEANQDDDIFIQILENRIDSVFEFFSYKEQFIQQKLHTLNQWNTQQNQYFNSNLKAAFNQAIKAISFFGLNKAVEYHCGIAMDRLKQSKKFALDIIKCMKNKIDQKNRFDNENFCLSQPNSISLESIKPERKKLQNENTQMVRNSYKMIRENSNLSLTQKMELFKSFSNLLEGGSLFEIPINGKNYKKLNLITDLLLKYQFPAFTFIT
jgi:ribonucleoside-triphosphate reductase